MAPTSFHVQDLLSLPTWALACLPVALIATYILVNGIYNVYFHPLANIPGPKAASFFQHYFIKIWLSGKYPYHIKALHDKYGPVVRVGPSQVSFNTPSSWKEIYGHIGGRKQFMKSDFYEGDGRPKNIVSSRSIAEHGAMRKMLSNAFSAKALSEQEETIQSYVDTLVKQVGKHATGKPNGEEMVKWYNWATFDIIGDLAFGDPFGCLKAGVEHSWVSSIMDATAAGSYYNVYIKYIGNSPFGKWIKGFFVPRYLFNKRQNHFGYAKDKVMRRVAKGANARKDFMSNILNEKEAQEISNDTLTVQSALLIVAGSETTATFLSGVTYYLCRSPNAYKKLLEEIRTTFTSYDEITARATEHCKYLKAVIDEGLRIYPPVPIGMPRFSPGEYVDGIYLPQGTECFTSSWAATHSEDNFHKPYEFIPERWLDKDCKDKKDASQPFLLGSRVCLGRNLALVEMRLILAKLFWAYDMQLKNQELDWVKDSQCNLLWRKPDMFLDFTRREGVYIPPVDDEKEE
ncbi:cytochrome P450 [Pyronema omphalodes]|nr:cytochrome P450 [Pyronema omphalodes]